MDDNSKNEETNIVEVDEYCENDPGVEMLSSRESRREEAEKKRKQHIKDAIGKGKTAEFSFIAPIYYWELMAWALNCHIEEQGWNILNTFGYHLPGPVYIDVNAGCGIKKNVVRHGVLILERNEKTLTATISAKPDEAMIVVTGSDAIKADLKGFVKEIQEIMQTRNFYRGQRIQFGGRITFVEKSDKTWEDLVLDERTKDSIWGNTIGFLNNRERLKQYGIPFKRGVLLVGEPGTGKTLACKALLSKAEGITQIVSIAGAFENPDYLTYLYEMAQDLSPSIVLIEDVDLIAQEREEFGYSRGSALLTLLSVLDGVEECDGVITIATTNCKETLDKAISKRPSRFDRIIYFPRPALKQRAELILLLCRKVPLDVNMQEYLARKTENFTPAQIQEVIYSLAIDYCNNNTGDKPECLILTRQEVDIAIGKINRDNKQQGIGFSLPINGNMGRCGVHTPASNEMSK